MEFTASKDDLLRELGLIQGIVERKNTIPVLANVLIEAQGSRVELVATDLDVGLRSRVPAEVTDEGALTLSAKKLYEIVRAVPEASIRVKELENHWASVTAGRSYFKMVGLSNNEFPSLAEPPAEPLCSLAGDALREMVHKTSFAITADESRYFLNGARLEIRPAELRMIATDGHRLAYIAVPRGGEGQGEAKFIVPRKTLLELVKILGEDPEARIDLTEGENHLFFRLGERLLVSKKVEDQFPAYEKVIPQGNDRLVEVEREALAGAIRRVSLLANERSRAVRLAIQEGTMEVSSQSPELGEARESVEVNYQGDELTIGFNGQYLLDFLGAADSRRIRMELKDDASQGLLRPSEEGAEKDYRYVVMPMRL